MYKIVFFDIDGTLLPSSQGIPDSAKQSVLELQKKGIETVIATGRPIADTVDIAKELQINSYITFNGSHAVYKGEEIFRQHWDAKTVASLFSISQQHQHDILFMKEHENALYNRKQCNIKSAINHLEISYKENKQQTPPEEVMGAFLATKNKEDITHYQAIADISFDASSSSKHDSSYNVLSHRINKGTAIWEYLSHLNLSPKEAVAFGDGLNDKEMLSFVGMGIAMGNASPILHAYAKMVTTNDVEDGIRNGLKEIGLL